MFLGCASGAENHPERLVAGEVRDGPVVQCAHLVMHIHERYDMDVKPDQQCEDAFEMQPVFEEVDHRFIPADNGHFAFVEVFEWFQFFAFRNGQEVFGQMAALLNSHLRLLRVAFRESIIPFFEC